MGAYRSGEGPLDGMVEWLISNAEAPPKEVKGVSQGFLDGEWFYKGEAWRWSQRMSGKEVDSIDYS